jgi:biopolymer transport protein ExbB/TolQ
MWAILGFFAVGIVITIERLIFLFGTSQMNPEQLMAKIASLIRKGSIEGAIASVSEEKAPLARIIEAALRNYKGTERDIQNAVDEMALAELPRINARIGFLAMLANVSTMVGLLGTIFGLIAAFAAVAAADPEQKSVLLANGISQAMNTTAFGLISAIPLLIVHSVLTSKADSLVDDIDRYSVMVMNMLAQARKEA